MRMFLVVGLMVIGLLAVIRGPGTSLSYQSPLSREPDPNALPSEGRKASSRKERRRREDDPMLGRFDDL